MGRTNCPSKEEHSVHRSHRKTIMSGRSKSRARAVAASRLSIHWIVSVWPMRDGPPASKTTNSILLRDITFTPYPIPLRRVPETSYRKPNPSGTGTLTWGSRFPISSERAEGRLSEVWSLGAGRLSSPRHELSSPTHPHLHVAHGARCVRRIRSQRDDRR